MEAAKEVKEYGRPNDLVDRIAKDPSFGFTKDQILEILNPDHLCGRAPKQVEEFIKEEVDPILEKYKELIRNIDIEVNV